MKFTSNIEDVLKKLQERTEKLNGLVDINKILTPSFMSAHSQFSSFSELLEAGNYKVENAEDFKAIPDDEFDDLISRTTKFKTWKQMQQAGGVEYVKNGLKL